MKKHIAIYVEGGMVQAVRSNIGPDIEIEVVDADIYDEEGENFSGDYWNELQEKLEFGNY